MLTRLLTGSLVLGLLAAACSSSDDARATTTPPPTTTDSTVTLYPTTKVIDAASITDAAADLSTLHFAALSDAVAKVALNDVVLAGIGPKTPNGVMRRVTAIDASNGVTFTTTRAGLADAIQTGHIVVGNTPLQKASAGVKSEPGAHIQSLHVLDDPAPTTSVSGDVGKVDDTLKPQFTIGVDEFEIVKGIKANASMGFGLGVALDLTINLHEVQGTFVLKGVEQANVELTGKLASSFDKSVKVGEVDFPPIPIEIDGVPIVITTELDVNVGVKGYTKANMHWSASEKATMAVGVSIGTDGVSMPFEGGAEATSDPLVVTGEADLKAYAGLTLKVSFNAGILDAALSVGAQGYVGAKADYPGPPCLTLSEGIDGNVGVDVSLLGGLVPLAKTSTSGRLYDNPFYTGDCSTNPLAVTPWAAVIGSTDYDINPHVAVLPDQSVVLLSDATANSGYVTRLATDGSVAWENHIGGIVTVANASPDVSGDGSSWIFGESATTPIFVHLDPQGAVTSSSLLVGSGAPVPDGTLWTSAKDGGVLMGGQTLDAANNYVMWAGKLDPSGKLAWLKSYGPLGQPRAIAEANDGGILLAGQADLGGAKLQVTRLSPSGEPIFARTYGEGRLYGITPVAGGGMAAAGATATGNGAVVLRLADDGSVTWSFDYEDTATTPTEYQARAIVERSDGLLVAGHYGFSDAQDFWAMQLTATGDLGWSRSFGGTKAEEVEEARHTSDNGAVLVGTTQSFGGTNQTLVMRLPPSGAIDFAAGSAITSHNASGAKNTVPGFADAITQTAVPSSMNATTQPTTTEDWPLTPTTAKRTDLAP